MTTDPTPPAPGTEPSDEVALTMSIHEAIYGESCASDHPATFYTGANAAIHAVLASPWLAADRQRVAREAVEEALAGVEAGVAETLSRHSYDKSQARLGLAMAVKIIAAALALALAALAWSQRGPWLNPGRWDEPPDEWRGWRAP